MEVSEEKANQRVEEFKREMKTLTVRLKEAENRAESAEKQVKRLQKEVDRLEGMCIHFKPILFVVRSLHKPLVYGCIYNVSIYVRTFKPRHFSKFVFELLILSTLVYCLSVNCTVFFLN